jgi:hypothetical protein
MHDDNNDDKNSISAGGGTEIPKRQGSRRGQLRRLGLNDGNNDDCGEGNCDGCSDNK